MNFTQTCLYEPCLGCWGRGQFKKIREIKQMFFMGEWDVKVNIENDKGKLYLLNDLMTLINSDVVTIR